MAPRPPDRPKSAWIPERDILECVKRRDYSLLDTFPSKVVKTKLEKLADQRKVLRGSDGSYRLTEHGKNRLLELEESPL